MSLTGLEREIILNTNTTDLFGIFWWVRLLIFDRTLSLSRDKLLCLEQRNGRLGETAGPLEFHRLLVYLLTDMSDFSNHLNLYWILLKNDKILRNASGRAAKAQRIIESRVRHRHQK